MYQFSVDALNKVLDGCAREAFFSSINLGQYNRNAVRAKDETMAMKSCITNYLISQQIFTKESFANMLDRTLYYTDWQRDNIAEQCYALMKRFVEWDNWCDYCVVQGGFSQTVSFADVETSVSGDFVLRDGTNGNIVMCKIIKNAPTLSSHGRAAEKNKPYNSYLLGALHKAGKIMFPEETISVALFHIKGKDDKATEIQEQYDYKPGKNLILYTFTDNQIAALDNNANNIAASINLRNAPDCRRNNKCTECNYFSFCKSLLVTNETSPTVIEEGFKVDTGVPPTPEQQTVIDAQNGMYVVNAAAGCGKTLVLVFRITALLEKGVAPEKILAITFTNKASKELKDRIERHCLEKGLDVDVSKIVIKTFNGFGYDIVKDHKNLLGFTNANIAEKIDLFETIFEVCEDEDLTPFKTIKAVDLSNPILQFMNKKGIIPFLWEYFNKIKVQHWTTVAEIEVDETQEGFLTHAQAETIYRLYHKFMRRLREKDLVEYQDQINYCLELFENHPEVKSRYQFDHIMVDEYQDTDSSQVILLKHLLDNGFESFMCVGDDAQAIYAFRLADYTNIVRFSEDFKDYGETTPLKITKNFRSTNPILQLGNEINHHHDEATFVAGKDLNGERDGEKPNLIFCTDEQVEFEWVRKRIEEILSRPNSSYNDVAIIARTRNELTRLSWYLEENQIPYIIKLSKPLIEDREVIAIKCVAETLCDTDNRFSFLTALAIQEEENEELFDLNVADLFQYIDNKIKGLEFPDDLEERLIFFYNYCDTHFSSGDAAKKLLKLLKEQEFENFAELNDYLTQMFDFEDSTSVDDKSSGHENAVTLITAHTAKGKEWKNVILLMDQFANANRNKDDLSIAEERRLLFVAVTRARDSLLMLQYNDKTYNFGTEMVNAVNMFNSYSIDQVERLTL